MKWPVRRLLADQVRVKTCHPGQKCGGNSKIPSTVFRKLPSPQFWVTDPMVSHPDPSIPSYFRIPLSVPHPWRFTPLCWHGLASNVVRNKPTLWFPRLFHIPILERAIPAIIRSAPSPEVEFFDHRQSSDAEKSNFSTKLPKWKG